ncbi:hypothetical protein CEXT_177181 [Caerostris extrusa]|uniref:Uncharacterized protein n=1 Tax=Caerostris extrusa TaxID=172846 RepID=A0AAV4WYN2_CAEEX|nr:hypothetical protein CEXT_177181 [Caerostris extrusa]
MRLDIGFRFERHLTLDALISLLIAHMMMCCPPMVVEVGKRLKLHIALAASGHALIPLHLWNGSTLCTCTCGEAKKSLPEALPDARIMRFPGSNIREQTQQGAEVPRVGSNEAFFKWNFACIRTSTSTTRVCLQTTHGTGRPLPFVLGEDVYCVVGCGSGTGLHLRVGRGIRCMYFQRPPKMVENLKAQN